jgi:hypothetical protein
VIDLALVEDGIEFGKKMMAEMIATYTAPPAREPAPAKPAPAQEPASPGGGGGYLNELRSMSAAPPRQD